MFTVREDWYTICHLFRHNHRDIHTQGIICRLQDTFKLYGYRHTACRRMTQVLLGAYGKRCKWKDPYWEAIHTATKYRLQALEHLRNRERFTARAFMRQARHQIKKAESIKMIHLASLPIKYPRPKELEGLPYVRRTERS